MKKQLLILLLLGCSIIGFSQEVVEPTSYGIISTDRPDQTEASNLVPVNFLQIETGAFYQKLGDLKATTLNTTLLRYGLLEHLELRLGFDNTSVKFGSQSIANGFSPLLVGVKIAIAEEKGAFPEIAFIGHINMPFFASNDYKTKSTGTDFRFSLAHTLSEKSSLGYNIGMAWDGDVTSAIYLYTIAYAYSFTKTFGGYMELYGDIYEDSNFNHLWNAGFTYLLSDNIQLDISGGTGITKNIQDLFLSAGISIRIPE